MHRLNQIGRAPQGRIALQPKKTEKRQDRFSPGGMLPMVMAMRTGSYPADSHQVLWI
jgi:hypothetical protein